jgi:undecaprenyl-diphosphatase
MARSQLPVPHWVLPILLGGAAGCATPLHDLDVRAFRLVNGVTPNPGLDGAMLLLSNEWSLIAVALLFAVLVRPAVETWTRVLLLGVAALVLMAGVDWSGSVLKQQIGRQRPCQGLSDARAVAPCPSSSSLPSNHAVDMFALAAFTVTCTRRRAVVWFGLAALVGYSRVHLGMHYPLDVLAGAVWGAALGWAAGVGMRRLMQRWPVPPPLALAPQSDA